jgi:hypothetical protein
MDLMDAVIGCSGLEEFSFNRAPTALGVNPAT